MPSLQEHTALPIQSKKDLGERERKDNMATYMQCIFFFIES